MGTRVTYAARQDLLRQGERGDCALLLLQGCVKVVVNDPDSGEQVLLSVRVAGDLLGEMAVFDGGPRSATVVAATDVIARRLGRTQFLAAVDQHPALGRATTAMVSERLRWANRRRADFVATSAALRVRRVLVEVAETYGVSEPEGLRLDVSLTQRDLGCLAGVKLAAVERSLRELEERGLIERRRRQILVRNRAGLRDVANLTPETRTRRENSPRRSATVRRRDRLVQPRGADNEARRLCAEPVCEHRHPELRRPG